MTLQPSKFLPPNNKYEIINSVCKWANDVEKADQTQTAILESRGLEKIAKTLSNAIATTLDTAYVKVMYGEASRYGFVQTQPLKVGALNSHFNEAGELTHQAESIKTHDRAVYVRSGMYEGDPKLCFRIAHDGGTQYLCTTTPDNDDVANIDNVIKLNNKHELVDYLHDQLPDFLM